MTDSTSPIKKEEPKNTTSENNKSTGNTKQTPSTREEGGNHHEAGDPQKDTHSTIRANETSTPPAPNDKEGQNHK